MRNQALLDHGELRMRIAFVFLFAALLGIPCSAQDGKQESGESSKPDFSGTWELNPKESEFLTGSGKSKRTNGHEEKTASGKENIGLATLIIEHCGPELKVFQKRRYSSVATSELIFYSDGRGENNEDTVNGIVTSKTAWDGTSLVTTFFRKSDTGDESSTMLSRTTWELSNDGQTLTITKIDMGYASSLYPGFSKGIPVNTRLVYQRTQG